MNSSYRILLRTVEETARLPVGHYEGVDQHTANTHYVSELAKTSTIKGKELTPKEIDIIASHMSQVGNRYRELDEDMKKSTKGVYAKIIREGLPAICQLEIRNYRNKAVEHLTQ